MPLPRTSVPSGAYSHERMISLNAPGEYETFLENGELRPRLAKAVDLARLEAGEWVLDMGSGRGEVSVQCARAGAHVLSVDYSEDCLSLTTRAALKWNASLRGRVVPLRADSKGLPLASNSVSRVLMLDVVEHLFPWELELSLAEAFRVLKPGGYLVIHTLPNRWALDFGYRCVRSVLRMLPEDPRSANEREIHVNEQDIVSLYRSLRRAGFVPFVWLDASILDQARWQHYGRPFPDEDKRARVYPLLASPLARLLLRLAILTPLRFVLANDIYSVAFKGKPLTSKEWGRRMERWAIKLAELWRGKTD